MMKKLLCAVLTALMVFSLFACAEKSSGNHSIVGTWKYSLNEKYRDVITDVILDSRVYVDIYYTFNEDGTGRSYASDNSFDREFTYVFNGDVITITSDGYSFDQKCVLTDTTLTIHDDNKGDDVVFKKQ